MTAELIMTIIFGILAYVVMGAVFLSKLNTAVEVLKVSIDSHQQANKEEFARLEKKQDKHNCLMERQFKLENKYDVLSEKVDVSNHRVADLEDETRKLRDKI